MTVSISRRRIAHSLEELEEFSQISLRRIGTLVEETFADGTDGIVDHAGAPSSRKQAVAYAVITNPWTGTDATEDLSVEASFAAPILAKEISSRLLRELGGADAVQAFGKATVVGLNGEVEHGGAFIHTPFFGNIFRELLGGTSIICFSESRDSTGTDLQVPMWHKTQAATRDFYQSIEVHLPDAPHPDELVIIGAASNGPRPHPRIGDRATDPAVDMSIFDEPQSTQEQA